jgi:hypothetical protein
MNVLIKPRGSSRGIVSAEILNEKGEQAGREEYYLDLSQDHRRGGPDYAAFYWTPGVVVWFDARVVQDFINRSKGKRKAFPATIPEVVPPAGLQLSCTINRR